MGESTFWTGLRARLGRIFRTIGHVQSTVLLGLYYILFLPLPALWIRWTRDPLRIRRPQADSYWDFSKRFPKTLEEARRQS